MFETIERVLRQLRAGEDSWAEFKELGYGTHGVVSPNAKAMAAEMVAFANAEGGTIFLGVADDGSVTGIHRARRDLVEQWVLNIATNRCDPPIRPTVRPELLPGPDAQELLVMLVEIPSGLFPHAAGGRYYARLGSTKRGVTGPELARLFQERGRAYVFDEQRVHTAGVDTLDMNRVDAFFGGAGRIPLLDLLRNTRVTAVGEDAVPRPTVAGLLAFSSDPKPHLPSAYIEAACYSDVRLTSDDLVRAERIAGPVSDQIDRGVAFVMHFMGRGRADDSPQYDIDVVDEAVVNAVAHRDYSISGSKVRLFLYSDRLEIYSPGGLPNGITIDEMPYRTFTRNQLLVSFLSRMRSARTGRHYLESRGEGVRKILDDGEAHSGRRPVYELFGNELRLTIWGRGDASGRFGGAAATQRT